MAYLSQTQLEALGFKKLGKNVKISEKASIYNADQMEVGDHVRIDDFCVVSGKVIFRRHVHIAPLCLVAGGEKGITFDDFSGLSYGCQVFTQSDDYTGRTMTNPTIPDDYKLERKEAVYIGRHGGCGANSVVFPGVRMEEGSVTGAMSLLTKSTEPWSIYFGIPAKRMKERKKDLLELEKKFEQSLREAPKP